MAGAKDNAFKDLAEIEGISDSFMAAAYNQ